MAPSAGTLLLAAPALADPNFRRAVILLCAHNAEGTFGLVLNRPLPLQLGDVLEEPALPGAMDRRLYQGGPVQIETLHFLHAEPDAVPDAVRIVDGVGWGGSFDEAIARLAEGAIASDAVRFFLGYAGWGPDQLHEELEEGSWIVAEASADLIFEEGDDALWRRLMRGLGSEYALLANYPDDPRMN